jgi:hypothetical protein
LAQDGRGKRDPLPAETQLRLNLQLPDVDVLLELAGKKLARLRIQPGDVRREIVRMKSRMAIAIRK